MSGRPCKDRGGNSMWANEWGSTSTTNFDETSSAVDDEDFPFSDTLSLKSYATLNHGSVDKWDVKERMKRLLENQWYTDVTFYPKDNRNACISAHRAILAVGSPLFAKMLFGDQRNDTSGTNMEVAISNLPFDAFTNIVKYMYTDEVFFESDSLVQGILEGAKQFGLKSLVNRCKQYFDSVELTEENVCSKLQMSVTSKVDALKERCLEFIQRNTSKVIHSPDFRNCSPNMMRTICKLQSLNIRSEMELLEAVMNWIYAQPPQSRKQLLEPLLKCIRFLNFSVTELGDTIKKYPNLLTSEEGLSIMLFLYNPPKNPNYKSLPSWCNKSTTNRCFFREIPGGNVDSSSGTPGKILLPLKSDSGQGPVSELTSLVQLRCIGGQHIIKAIRLTFEKPISDRSTISSLSIKVHCHSSGFNWCENVQIMNSESVRVEFSKLILARRGDLVDIEAEAKNIKYYRFLQFDESQQVPSNPHFNCCVSSRPKQDKLYFISEIEYQPQDRRRGKFVPNRVRTPRPVPPRARNKSRARGDTGGNGEFW